MTTTVPKLSRSFGRHIRVTSATAMTLVSKTQRQSSRVVSSSVAFLPTPALLTRTLRRPTVANTSERAWAASSSFVRSATKAEASPNSSTTRPTASADRPPTMTWCVFASSTAIACPRPRVAPVIRATGRSDDTVAVIARLHSELCRNRVHRPRGQSRAGRRCASASGRGSCSRSRP